MAKLVGESLFSSLLLGRWQEDDWWDCPLYRCKFRLKTLINPITTVQYIKKLSELDDAKLIIEKRPFVPTKLQRPYLHKRLGIKDRANAIVHHDYFIQHLINPNLKSALLSDQACLLADFKGKDDIDFTMTCMPSKYDKEGEITLTLNFEHITVANLSFTFICHNHQSIAYIAGLQGAGANDQDIIKKATKACYGLFPKRALYEGFCALMKLCGISVIHAVSNDVHIYKQWRYRSKKQHKFVANYDEFWCSLNGHAIEHGYQLPIAVPRKLIEEISSKKRSEYRNRYTLLDQINSQIEYRFNLKQK